MALKKEIAVNGVVCNYWKIIDRQDSSIKNKTTVHFGVYASADTRKQNAEFIMEVKEVILDGFNLSFQQIYDMTVKLPYFEGSIPC